MPTFTPQQSQQAIQDLLQHELPELMGIYLFGSQAQQAAGPESDVDLAVLVEGYVGPLRLWELSNSLANQFGIEVDLVDLRAASTVMQHQVLTTGQRWWRRGPETDHFELFVLSEKFDMDIWRKPLIDQIQQQGQVHG
ncbi:MAG: type VII toxin-antitoxin system MntA family adenylyltransferase antitoxin [Saccharospirillum sp.]